VAVGAAAVKVERNVVTLARRGDPIDVLRAAASAIWGAGVPIYALDVAPELYASQLSWGS
jgi:glycerol 3-phosphatase-2